MSATRNVFEMKKRETAGADALYCGTVRHHRSTPIVNTFTHRVYFAYLDVDALPNSLDRLPLWSARRPAPIHYRRRDFFDGASKPLGDAVRDLVEERLGKRPTGRVCLLAQLRTFGWLFNPLAVYYCWRAGDGSLDAIVLEVTNTPWAERHHYVIDACAVDAVSATLHTSQPKALHVSPFLPMNIDYAITWTVPGDTLSLRIEGRHGDHTSFFAELAVRRRPLNSRNGTAILATHPLMPMRVSASIYFHAMKLFGRGVPLHGHPEPARIENGR